MNTRRRNWIWYCWMSLIGASFAYMERRALTKEDIPPLSSALREMFGIHPRRRWGRWTLVVLGCVWTWLTIHLVADITESGVDNQATPGVD